jgi:hypothetical protein
MSRSAWFAMDTLFLEDAKIERLGESFGPGGPLAIVALLGQAKIQGRGGRVEWSLRALSSAAFLEDKKQAASILSAAGEADVIEIDALDARAFVVRLINWRRWQDRFRKAMEGGGSERKVTEASGEQRKRAESPVRATGTETVTETKTTAQEPDVVPSSLHPFTATLNRVVEGKSARALNMVAAGNACEQFRDRDLRLEAEKFEHYWLHGAGQNRRLRDVAGAWRNWLRSAPPAGIGRRNGKAARVQARYEELRARGEAIEGTAQETA